MKLSVAFKDTLERTCLFWGPVLRQTWRLLLTSRGVLLRLIGVSKHTGCSQRPDPNNFTLTLPMIHFFNFLETVVRGWREAWQLRARTPAQAGKYFAT